MDVEICARCTYMSDTAMLLITASTSFDQLCADVCAEFCSLKSGLFEMRYSVSNYSNCLLKSDKDLKMMVKNLVAYKLEFVDITVKDFVGCESSISVDRGSVVDDCLSTVLDENDYLDNFKSEAPKNYLSREWKDYIQKKGQKFEGGVVEFREKLAKYAIEVGFLFTYVRNDKERVIADCSNKESQGCKWHIHGVTSSSNGFFYISELNNVHSCNGLLRLQSSKLLGSHVVKSVIDRLLRVDLSTDRILILIRSGSVAI